MALGCSGTAARPRYVASAALALVALTACSSDTGTARTPTGSPTAATSTTSSPTDTPGSTTPWTMQQAADEFVRIVEPVNTSIAALQKLGEGAPVKDVNTACGAVAEAQQQTVREVAQGSWPAEVSAEVTAFASAVTADQAIWAACAGAKDPAALEQAVARLGDLEAPAAAAALRAKLGLE